MNVFTQSDYAVISLPSFADRSERIRYVSSMRAQEDQMFADACNLTRHDLRLEEPPVLGILPFDLSHIQFEVDHLNTIMIEGIASLHQSQALSKPALYCPIGIGGHRNHVSVLAAVVGALPRLQELYEVFFYEDLHYASDLNFRNAGLQRLSGMLKGRQLERRALVLPPQLFARKMGLVNIYFSQHGGKLRSYDFIPATFRMREEHEAVWALI